MNGILSVVLLVSICAIQATSDNHIHKPCESMQIGARCVPSNSRCQEIIRFATCKAGEKCCVSKGRKVIAGGKPRAGAGKRKCKKTTKKCKRKGGSCVNQNDECKELIDENLCKGQSCRCCKASPCKIKKKCTQQGGKCVTDPKDCNGKLGKGCKGKGCQCCVPTVMCGLETSAPSRIVNGVDVDVPRKYSWQVGLKGSKADSDGYYCGGSIITNKHILTAAHCFYTRACEENIPDEVYVGIGDHKQEETTDNLPDFLEPILAKQIFINPDFDCDTMNIDVAVIELSKPIDLLKNADVIHPICLPKAGDSMSFVGETATVTGWGSTIAVAPGDTSPSIDFPNVLQEVQVPVLKNSECDASLTDYMICTATTGGKDACIGDSGGPVMVEENGQYTQIGIVSFGVGCGIEGKFGAHACVTKVLDWVKEQVGSETTYTKYTY